MYNWLCLLDNKSLCRHMSYRSRNVRQNFHKVMCIELWFCQYRPIWRCSSQSNLCRCMLLNSSGNLWWKRNQSLCVKMYEKLRVCRSFPSQKILCLYLHNSSNPDLCLQRDKNVCWRMSWFLLWWYLLDTWKWDMYTILPKSLLWRTLRQCM